MTNYERLIDRDCLTDNIFKLGIEDNAWCKSECCMDPFNADTEDCKKCIAKWLDKEC